jgi:hypothetical protein
MGYEQATATKMLATHCCVCGRPLRDVASVEAGIGPVCAERLHVMTADLPAGVKAEVSRLVNLASQAFSRTELAAMLDIAGKIAALGAATVALKIVEATVPDAVSIMPVTITEAGRTFDVYSLSGPYVDGTGAALRAAGVRGARYANKSWTVPRTADNRRALYAATITLYPGAPLVTPKGVSRVPKTPFIHAH